MSVEVIPKVSIVVLTYNHNEYIRDSILSCINQKTNFPYELIICDDFSTDGTTDTIKSIYQNYPELIVLSLQNENTGGPKNFEDGLRKVRGKYIALCEGDDFWCDPDKLQIQYDFMENNPDFTFCFHNTKVLYEFEAAGDAGFFPSAEYIIRTIQPKDGILTLKDLIGTYEAHTSSYFGRWPFYESFPDDWNANKGQDLFLMPIIVGEGRVRHINRLMSMYRRHESGYALLMNTSYREFFMKKGKQWVDLYLELNQYTHEKYTNEVMHRANIALKSMTLYLVSHRKFGQLESLLFEYYDCFFSRTNMAYIFDMKYPITSLMSVAFRHGGKKAHSKKRIVCNAVRYIKFYYYLGFLFQETIEL